MNVTRNTALSTDSYTAFRGHKQLARGDLATVVAALKASDSELTTFEPILLSLDTGERKDIDWRGSVSEVLAQLSPSVPGEAEEAASTKTKRGRPKLGVVAREITLLPRHWEWLSNQSGGASVTLRKLVDQARNNPNPQEILQKKQGALQNILSVLAGDLPNYEEAVRALYRTDKALFMNSICEWPGDLHHLVVELFEQLTHYLEASNVAANK